KENVKVGKQKGKSEKKKGPDRNLKPNPKIKIFEKDPFFETNEKVPEVSPRMTTKLIFRAVNLGSVESVKDLLARTEGVTNRSMVGTALDFAVQQAKGEIVQLLTHEHFETDAKLKKERKAPPACIISATGTGNYNPLSLGIKQIRVLNMSRGGKEGDNAFVNDLYEGNVDLHLIKNWMEYGVSVDTLETFLLALSSATKTTRDEQ
ncbi:unnamed protein product, partial [Candidula unifasciata]